MLWMAISLGKHVIELMTLSKGNDWFNIEISLDSPQLWLCILINIFDLNIAVMLMEFQGGGRYKE